jgi:hypothetical protein
MPTDDEQINDNIEQMISDARAVLVLKAVESEANVLRAIYDMGFTDGYNFKGDHSVPPEGFVLGLIGEDDGA